MSKYRPSGFIVVLPHAILEIPQDSNLSWLTLFYALPKELVEKRPEYLKLPRNIRKLLASPESMDLIQTESFLELVWDCYAWSAWQFFQVPKKDGTYQDIPGDWQHYSGDFPLWRWSYKIIHHFRMKFETEMEWSFQQLFLMSDGEEFPWLTYQQFGNLVGNLTDMIVAKQNWQPMFDEIWKNRQIEDYVGKNSHKRDFVRSWTHSRTAKHISFDDVLENGVKLDGDMLYDLEDPCGQFEEKVVGEMYIEQFKGTLTEQDKVILQMRYEGYSLKEIAEKVGFKTPSAVGKRIEKIAGSYEDFLGDEYSSFLDKCMK